MLRCGCLVGDEKTFRVQWLRRFSGNFLVCDLHLDLLNSDVVFQTDHHDLMLSPSMMASVSHCYRFSLVKDALYYQLDSASLSSSPFYCKSLLAQHSWSQVSL